jgi:hypothetical protein
MNPHLQQLMQRRQPMPDPRSASPVADYALRTIESAAQRHGLQSLRSNPEALFKALADKEPTDIILESIDQLSQQLNIRPPWAAPPPVPDGVLGQQQSQRIAPQSPIGGVLGQFQRAPLP